MTRKPLSSLLPVPLRVLALVCIIIPAVLSSQDVTGSVTVDFAAVRRVNSASGLLYGTTTTTAAERLAPLGPRFWRYSDFHWPQPISPSTIFYRRADLARHFRSIVPDVETHLLLANGCEVNDLTYHTLDDSPPGIARIVPDAQDARRSFLENPRYAPLKIRRIVINEIVGPRYTHQPAGTLTHHAEFEAGGADLGGRSAWSNPEVFGGMLAGLLIEGSLQPRSVWWAHKLYADGVRRAWRRR